MQRKNNTRSRGGLGYTDFQVFVSPMRSLESPSNSKIERKIHKMEQRAGKLVTRGMVVEGFAIYEGVLGMRVNTLGAANKDTLAYARTFFLKANEWSMSLLKQNQISNALTILLRCEQLLSSGWIRRFPSYQHLTSNNLACCFKKQNKLRTAQRYLEKALKVAHQFPDDVESPSLTHLNLCVIHHQLKQPRSAMEHAQKSVVGFEKEIESLKEEISKLSALSSQKYASLQQGEGSRDQTDNPQVLSESELNDLQNLGSEKTEQKRTLLQKDLKEKETLLAIGCYNLAVQHQHQHNWPECFQFYQKAIEKCEKSLGAQSKLVVDFKEAYDRAKKHHSNRGGNYSPSKDITAGLSGVSYPQSRGKDGGISQIEELRKSAIRQITPKSKGKGSILNDIDQEYWNYNSPERKKKIMMHYLTAVKLQGSSPLRKNIKGTLDFRPNRSTSQGKQRGRGHFSEQSSFRNSRVMSEEQGTLQSMQADVRPSDAWQSEGQDEFEKLDRQGQYQWGRPQNDRDQNLQNVMISHITTLPHRVGGGYDYRAPPSRGSKRYDPLRRSANQKMYTPTRRDQRSRSQGHLIQIYGKKNKNSTPERYRGKTETKKDTSPITSPTLDSHINQDSVLVIQRYIRGFVGRKRALEKQVFYSGKYTPRGEDSNPLLLKIRLNKKEPDNPLIDFLLYCQQTTPQKVAKHEKPDSSKLFKMFQISHPVSETPFKLCKSYKQFYNLGKEFAARLTGDMMIDFKRIKLDDSYSILEEYRTSEPKSLKTVKEVSVSDQISPDITKKKSKFDKKVELQLNPQIISDSQKVSSMPLSTVLYEGQRQLKLDQKTPVYVKLLVEQLNEEAVVIKAKHKHTNNQIAVQGELLGKRVSVDLRDKDMSQKQDLVLRSLVEKMAIKREDNQMNIEIGTERSVEGGGDLAQASITSKRSSIKSSEKLRGKQVQDMVNRLYKKPDSSLQQKRKSQPQTSSKLSSMNVSKDTRNEGVQKKNVGLKGSRGSTPLPGRMESSDATKSQEARQSRKLQKRGKLINQQSFILTISYQRNEDESVKYEVDGYNQKRRHHYKLKEIVLKKGDTEKNPGECAQIIFEKVEFLKPKDMRPDSEGKLQFDSDLHLRGIQKTPRVVISKEEEKKPELDVWDQEESAPPAPAKIEPDVFDEESNKDEKEQSHQISIKDQKSSRRSSYTSYKTQEKEPAKDTVSSLQVDDLQEGSIQSKVKSLKASSKGGQKSDRSSKRLQKNVSQASISSRRSEQSIRKEQASLPPKAPTPVQKEYEPTEDNLTVFEKEHGILVYVNKPSPDFLLIGVKDSIQFGERVASRDQVEDVIGEGLQDDEILLKDQLDQKLSPNVKVDYDLKLIAIVIPFLAQQGSKEGYQEEGPQRIQLILDEMDDNLKQKLSKFETNHRPKTDGYSKKIQGQKQKRPQEGKAIFLTHQLKTLRKERPPLVTKGAVKIGSKYYRYSAYSHYESKTVEFDFFNVSDKEIDTVGKEVSVHQLHIVIKKTKLEDWMDLSYIIHLFMKRVAVHGEWLDLPTIGDVIDSAVDNS